MGWAFLRCVKPGITVFTFLSAFLIIKYIIADTGISFAYDYFLNKLELNSTRNIVSIKYNIHEFEKSNDQIFKFEDIQGFGKKLIKKNDNQYKPSPDQLDETDEWIRSNGGDFSNKYSTDTFFPKLPPYLLK